MAKSPFEELAHEIMFGAKLPKVPAPAITFVWRWHDHTMRRVWLTNWFGDQFEIMSQDDFRVLETICTRFAIPLLEAEDD